MNRNTQPRYHHFSPYDFMPSDFLAAARCFLELRAALVAAEERSDAEHGHEFFVSCDLCDRWSELKSQYEFFANQFAYQWALKLVESAPPESVKKPVASATSTTRPLGAQRPQKHPLQRKMGGWA